MMDNEKDSKILELGICILYEDSTSKTYHLTVLDKTTDPPTVTSTIGTFNIVFEAHLSKAEKRNILARKLKEIEEFRSRNQEKINISFEQIMKKNFSDF